MKKRNSKLKPIWRYLRELSIVIIGVAITLLVSNIIVSIKEHKDLNKQLDAIYAELDDNQERVEQLIADCNAHDRLKELLIQTLDKSFQVNRDTMDLYVRHIGKVSPFTYKKGAYEMFLNSGAMKSLQDRELLMDITECYLILETTKEARTKYIDIKMQEIMKLYSIISDTELVTGVLDVRDTRYRSIFNFYVSISGLAYYPEQANIAIDKVLARRRD